MAKKEIEIVGIFELENKKRLTGEYFLMAKSILKQACEIGDDLDGVANYWRCDVKNYPRKSTAKLEDSYKVIRCSDYTKDPKGDNSLELLHVASDRILTIVKLKST